MTGASLRFGQQDGETWRQVVERIAGFHGLAKECLEYFDRDVQAGTQEADAAWCALYDWDCL